MADHSQSDGDPLIAASRWSPVAMLALVATVFAMAAAGQWSGEPRLLAIASGAWAALLLGILLGRKESAAWRVAGPVALALAAATGGYLVAGGAPITAAIQAGAMVFGVLACLGFLRWKRIEPAGLRDAQAF
ncbi:MAG: hypothetical protein KY442_06375, partial [Proteobacteria bacterium]|nr:hypothetical protein [Pseudomonadota bacterium]